MPCSLCSQFLYYKRRNTKKEADDTDSAYQDPRSGVSVSLLSNYIPLQ